MTSLRDFHKKRDNIVIIRESRGIGDILNCRLLFENFKRIYPKINITFCTHKEYLPLLANHPFLDNLVDIYSLKKEDYMASYNISTCCVHYESRNPQNTKHRAEIWAEHCGIQLKYHDPYLPFISKEKILEGQLVLKQFGKRKKVLFAPLAFEELRSLTLDQMKKTVQLLKNKGYFVCVLHNMDLQIFKDMDVPVLVGRTFQDWMSYIHAADYVVSVDTATFHYAGMIKKPLTGIFTYVDGKLRGKFYDFVLVQKHRDNGNWPCGPCYNYFSCTNPNYNKCDRLRPCLSELTMEEIETGINEMEQTWVI